MIRCKDLDETNKIDCIYQWFEKCPPQGKLKHWKDGRSAKETAKHWLLTIPQPFKDILKSFNITYKTCSPEYVTKLDNYRGNARNHDLLILGETQHNEKIVIAIESKVDESFGETISNTIKEAEKRISEIPSSNGLNRIKDLRLAIFGQEKIDQLDLMYQLLTALAGTIAEAKKQKSKKAIFIVQTFVSKEINKIKHEKNQQDLDDFIKYFTLGKYCSINEGEILGPLRIIGNNVFITNDIDLWIGKYTINI